MARHEYTELAVISPVSPNTADERTYRANGASQFGSAKRGVSALLRDPHMQRHILLSGLYILLWYSFSGILSVYNKWLFGSSERDFPFPLFVTSVHMLVQYLLAGIALWAFPKFKPTQTPTWSAYLTRAVPCGVAYALDTGLSNVSLRTITLTFYTMCKSSTLGFVLLFAFLFGLERVRLVLVAIIATISAGVVLMAAGEVDFILAGFLEVIGSSAMGGFRWSLTQILLSQARFGMNNPLATMYRLTPIVGTSILVFSLVLEHPFTEMTKNKNVDTPHGIWFMALIMILGGLVAFAMVLSEYFLIARTSVVTLSIAGMLKEVAMVGIAHLVFGDSMTLVNGCGLLVALLGIGMYNWLKINDMLHEPKPESVEDLEARDTHLRQIVFAAEPYDEVADVDLRSMEEWVNGRSQPLGDSDGISSGVADGSIARRRNSVFPGSSMSPKSPLSSSHSSELAQAEQPKIHSQPSLSPSDTDGTFTHE
ncbi:hypothetical protein LPJ78_002204 [Coemansia sp. RSA 989]|nr:hypothetical protein LPJ79_003155 [Coemansia sp. RSA 1821]KAJ1866003.1 hypothetical protein LPJ78_002204 [Coemansia sp. RSA 989]KAJ1873343.1 hypothetical protein LPJ55_002386 [Coemansia sp. RSA 990]KAJ2669785.1 hypothetical protein IWW42_004372 [Coemansia sp. RSA 1085]